MRTVKHAHRALLPLAALVTAACVGEHPDIGAGERVVLLHGLGRTDLSMLLMELELKERGYRVTNIDYPSTERSIEQLSEEELAPALASCCTGDGPIHFVTHSMGGIVLRYYLAHHEVENLGRVVMLSPPNQGSELADWVAENNLLQRIMGPSVEQIGTGPESVPIELGPVDFQLGVIAGNRTLNPIFSHMIPGEDDGKVAVAETPVEGMTDFLVVPHSHTYMMMNQDVIEQVAYFLENGRFRQAGPAGDGPSGELDPGGPPPDSLK